METFIVNLKESVLPICFVDYEKVYLKSTYIWNLDKLW